MKKILFCLAVLCGFIYANITTIEASPQAVENKNYQLIDIRTPMEWKQTGVIKTAYKISITTPDGRGFNKNFIKNLEKVGIDPNKPVALICRSGNRSLMAAKFLDKNGFKNIINLDGGVNLLEYKYNYKLYEE